MKYNFNEFIDCLKGLIEFSVEWDLDKWYEAYFDFKEQLKIINPEYVENHSAVELYTEFAREFYRGAKPETHDYWLKDRTS